jgi:hypothetical protein
MLFNTRYLSVSEIKKPAGGARGFIAWSTKFSVKISPDQKDADLQAPLLGKTITLHPIIVKREHC